MFGVTWTDPAMDELAAIYAPAEPDDRERILAAVAAIDGALRADAPGVGESRPAGYRITFAPPLGTLFTVDAVTRAARVERVWWYGRR